MFSDSSVSSKPIFLNAREKEEEVKLFWFSVIDKITLIWNFKGKYIGHANVEINTLSSLSFRGFLL